MGRTRWGRLTKTKEQQAKEVKQIQESMHALKRGDFSDFLRSPRNGMNAWNWQVNALFGVAPGHHLPDEHMEVWCQGIKVVLLTKAEARERGQSLLRVMQECNGCGKLIPSGRMHQHRRDIKGRLRDCGKTGSTGKSYPIKDTLQIFDDADSTFRYKPKFQ